MTRSPMNPERALGLLGIGEDGKLSPCPGSPNCVVSHYPEKENRTSHLEPIAFEGSGQEALTRLTGLIEKWPRSQIVEKSQGYLHVAFHSRLWGFVDDTEFLVDESSGLIHFRSASRLGYSDLGANRRRMAKIKKSFEALAGI